MLFCLALTCTLLLRLSWWQLYLLSQQPLLIKIFTKSILALFELPLQFTWWTECFFFFFLPGVSLAGEDSFHESLGWHPLDRQHGTTAFPVIAGSGKREMESDDEDWREIHHLENRFKKKKYIKLVPTCRCLEPFQSLRSWPLFPVQDRWADNFGQRCLWRNTHTWVKQCKFRRHVQKTPMNKPIVHSIISKIWS